MGRYNIRESLRESSPAKSLRIDKISVPVCRIQKFNMKCEIELCDVRASAGGGWSRGEGNFGIRIPASAKSEESLWKDPLPSRKGEA